MELAIIAYQKNNGLLEIKVLKWLSHSGYYVELDNEEKVWQNAESAFNYYTKNGQKFGNIKYIKLD